MLRKRAQVAITGGIGEGKSTVLSYLAAAGFSVTSSDEIAREVFDEPATQRKLAQLLGADGNVSRERMKQAVSEQPGHRRAINRIMHPGIMARIEEQGASFVEVPLLVEACLQSSFSRVWVVTCGPLEQHARLMLRYQDDLFVRRMIDSQLPSIVKSPFADVIVRTNEPQRSVNAFVIQAAEREMF